MDRHRERERDDILQTRYHCSPILIRGDFNHHLEGGTYEDLLTVQDLSNFLTFPTHEHGRTLDPIITELGEDMVTCHQLRQVSSSDHHAILTQVDVGMVQDEATS